MPSSACQKCALDRKSTRLNSSHTIISYAVFCLKKKYARDRTTAGRTLTLLRLDLPGHVGACRVRRVPGGAGAVRGASGSAGLDCFFLKPGETPEPARLSPPDPPPI